MTLIFQNNKGPNENEFVLPLYPMHNKTERTNLVKLKGNIFERKIFEINGHIYLPSMYNNTLAPIVTRGHGKQIKIPGSKRTE